MHIKGVSMFWLVFGLIIFFILFLLIVLLTSGSSKRKTMDSLKNEVAEKKKRPKPTGKKEKKRKVKVPKSAASVEEVVSVPKKRQRSDEKSVAKQRPADVVHEEPPVKVSIPVVKPKVVVEEVVVEKEPEPVAEPVVEEDTYQYSAFDHSRTMEEFGLDADEAAEFIQELIKQVEDELPKLEEAVQAQDEKAIEDISHMIKGSATNLGSGGIADVLIDFNTYAKEGSDPVIIAKHMRHLHRALVELKQQFS